MFFKNVFTHLRMYNSRNPSIRATMHMELQRDLDALLEAARIEVDSAKKSRMLDLLSYIHSATKAGGDAGAGKGTAAAATITGPPSPSGDENKS